MDFFSPHSIYMLSNYFHPINCIMYQQKAHFHHSSIPILSHNLQLSHFYNSILTKNIGNFFILSFSTLIFIFFIHQPITQQQKQKNNLFPFHSYSHDYSALFSRSLSIHFRLLFPRLSPTSDGPFYPLLTTLFFLSLVESFPLLSFLIFVDISYQSKLTYSLSSLSHMYTSSLRPALHHP